MPYSRPIRRFYLTPPSVPIFFISVVLALIAVLAAYGHFAVLKGVSAFLFLVIAYLIMLVGVLVRGI
jgi:small-conductance mechanosensitive channel